MVLDKLGDNLKNTLQKIAKSIFVDDKLINELIKDIQRALLQADVNVKLVFSLSNKIKKRIKTEKTPGGLTKKEHLVNIVYEELVTFLGGEGHKITIEKKPYIIMLVGLFGSGKTTTTGKLAKFFQKRGKKCLVVQTDTWRPAAYEQLEQTAKKINVDMVGDKKAKHPTEIIKKHEKNFKNYDIVLVDTAGRDALNDELIDELTDINKKINPDETLLVLSADIGQAAEDQAKKFHETCNVTGVIISKMDGTAKGGGSLSACSVTKSPVKFIGIGEKVDDLEEFNPKGFVGRMLGMGDLEALLEKAREAITEEEAEDMSKRLLKGDFNLIDLYDQMKTMKKMGSMSKLMEMIPGFGQLKLPKDVINVQESKIIVWGHVMDSCTKKELEEPNNISKSNIERIAKGSGTKTSDVRDLLKQYRQGKKVMKMFKGNSKKSMEKMMKKMGGLGNMKLR